MKFLTILKDYLLEAPKASGFTKCRPISEGDDTAGIDLTTGVFYSFKSGTLTLVEYLEAITGERVDLADLRFKLGNDSPAATSEFRVLYDSASDFGEFCKQYCALRGIDEEIAREAGLKETSTMILFPYFDIHGNLVGLKLRDPLTGAKQNYKGSSYALYQTYGARQLFKFLILVEGESDTLCFRTHLKKHGIKDIGVFGLPGDALKREHLRELLGMGTVVVIPDTDKGGQDLIDSAKKTLPQALIIELEWLPGMKGKDFSDWIAQAEDYKLNFLDLIEAIRSKSPSIEFLSSEAFYTSKEITEEKAIVSNLLYPGQLAFIAGPQKSRKTWFALELVRSIVHGEPLCGMNNFIGDGETKILFIEHEGSAFKLLERTKKVVGEEPTDKITWVHNSGLKIDNPNHVNLLIEKINELGVNLVIIDPFQNSHNCPDENSASLMGPFWEGLDNLMLKTTAAFVFLHHFNKQSEGQGFSSMRGSSRTAGELDVYFSLTSKGNETKLLLQGRDLDEKSRPISGDYFHLEFTENCRLVYCAARKDKVAFKMYLVELLDESPEGILLERVAQDFEVTGRSIKNWLKELPEFTTTAPGPNSPVRIIKNESN